MSRSRKKVAAHGIACGDDAQWKRDENRRLRRVNKQRVTLGRLPLRASEGGIYNLYKSPEDGRVIYHVPPDPNVADPDEIRWYRKSLRK